MKRLLGIVVLGALTACATADDASVEASTAAVTSCAPSPAMTEAEVPDQVTNAGLDPDQKCDLLEHIAQPGDLVFTEIASNPIGSFVFSHVADLTMSWTSHVGVVIPGGQIAEATISLFDSRSRKTSLCEFLSHSRENHFALRRLPGGFPTNRIGALEAAVDKRMGIHYDTGFNLDDADTTYCSKFVREIYEESVGVEVGRIQTLREIDDAKLASDPSYDDTLIRLWFFHLEVPWCRRMVTPATELFDPRLETIVSTD